MNRYIVTGYALSMVMVLFCANCAGTLQRHARAASTTATVLDGIGAAIEREAAEDYEALLRLPAEERGQRLETLMKSYQIVRVAYDTARAALASYTRAIVDANAGGEKTLAKERAKLLRDAWVNLADAADKLGIEVPSPADALVRLIGGER